jgi:hypothetical protein
VLVCVSETKDEVVDAVKLAPEVGDVPSEYALLGDARSFTASRTEAGDALEDV